MDTVKPEIARLFTAKEARRRRLAALPFSEKVRAVVRLQEMVAPVLASVASVSGFDNLLVLVGQRR